MKAEAVYWNKDIETLSSKKMIELQWNRIKDRLRYLKKNSHLYQKKFASIALRLSDIQNLDDFHRLVPFTTKEELQEERENIKQNISAKRKNQHVKGKNVLEDEDKNNLNFLNNSYYLKTIGLYIHIIY